jgi:hypothetical protein
MSHLSRALYMTRPSHHLDLVILIITTGEQYKLSMTHLKLVPVYTTILALDRPILSSDYTLTTLNYKVFRTIFSSHCWRPLSLLDPVTLLSTLFSNTLNVCSSVRDKFHTHTTRTNERNRCMYPRPSQERLLLITDDRTIYILWY